MRGQFTLYISLTYVVPIIAAEIQAVSMRTDGVGVLVGRTEESGLHKPVTGGAMNFLVFTVSSFIFV